jgi:hypothetical protein
MRSRVLAAVVAVFLTAGLVAGCGDDTDQASSGGRSVKELKSSPGSGSDSSSDNPDPSSDPSGSDSSGDDTETSIPGLDDLPDLSEFGNLGDCMNQATAYASLAMSALGGKDSAATAEAAVEKLKQELPHDLSDDLDVLADAYRAVAEKGIIDGAEAMDTPEFDAADQHISDYFEKTCATN